MNELRSKGPVDPIPFSGFWIEMLSVPPFALSQLFERLDLALSRAPMLHLQGRI
jgi:hypothetical protein